MPTVKPTFFPSTTKWAVCGDVLKILNVQFDCFFYFISLLSLVFEHTINSLSKFILKLFCFGHSTPCTTFHRQYLHWYISVFLEGITLIKYITLLILKLSHTYLIMLINLLSFNFHQFSIEATTDRHSSFWNSDFDLKRLKSIKERVLFKTHNMLFKIMQFAEKHFLSCSHISILVSPGYKFSKFLCEIISPHKRVLLVLPYVTLRLKTVAIKIFF